MDFLRPADWAEALAAKAEHPDAVPIAGGTDVMVELNFDRRRPAALLDLTRVGRADRLGHRRRPAADRRRRAPTGGSSTSWPGGCPGWRWPSRTVGSPQIRNRGTVGGNLGSASPAGDAHPPLLAAGALVELASVRGTRRVPVDEFFVGAQAQRLAPDELIAAFLVPTRPGPQQFAKVGTRNAMVIAVCSFALSLGPADAHGRHRHRLGRADPAARHRGGRRSSPPSCPGRPAARCRRRWSTRFGDLVGAAARPDRRRARHRRLPAARAGRAGPPDAGLGLDGSGRCGDEGHLHGQRRGAAGRRRLARREPALRAARAARPARREERLRAGRVRLVHGLPRRPAGLRLPGRGRPGAGPRR